jgi:hypothetical protein
MVWPRSAQTLAVTRVADENLIGPSLHRAQSVPHIDFRPHFPPAKFAKVREARITQCGVF